MTVHGVQFPDAQIAAFCRIHGVKRLSLFGSILHPAGAAAHTAFGPDSDVDLLVEFLPGQGKSLFDVGGMLMELRELLGRDVDLLTPQDLSPYFRDQVLHEAQTLYAA